jgi:FkbM family methyltransferase
MNMTHQSDLVSTLRKLKANGLEIKTVYDIGACVGRWTAQMKQGVLMDANFYMFEGNPAYKDILASYGHFLHVGILSNPGRDEVEFYAGTDTGDSYYKESTKHYENKEPTKLPCRTLDSLIQEHNLPTPDFLKIDTQGSELDILAGAESIIDKVDIVYLECPIINYNIGAPSIGEYIAYMKSKRFIPMDVLEIHRSEEVLLQVDILFIHERARNIVFGKNTHIKPFA